MSQPVPPAAPHEANGRARPQKMALTIPADTAWIPRPTYLPI